jgi:hypothetical protein
VKLSSVFLRQGCTLPNRFIPHQEAIGDHWTIVEDIAALALDTVIRQAGWHFIWVVGSCARRGIGVTRDNATRRALTRALQGIAGQFNAAELRSVQVATYPGFHIATVTVQPREIRQDASPEVVVGGHAR